MASTMNNGQQGNDSASVLMAFILGAVAGAAVALLLAPASGEDTRRAMNRRALESRTRLLDALRQGRGILNQRRDQVATAFDHARQEAQGGPREPEPEA